MLKHLIMVVLAVSILLGGYGAPDRDHWLNGAEAKAGAIQLPKSGQNTCYNASGTVVGCAGTGQDADKLAGALWPAPRFTDQGNGTMLDGLTGLVWLKNGKCTDPVGGITNTAGVNWSNALTWSNALASGSCGLADGSPAGAWRLPNRNELLSLVDHQQTNVATWLNSQGFSNVQSASTYDYWSANSYNGSAASKWWVNLGLNAGVRSSYIAASTFANMYILPVRTFSATVGATPAGKDFGTVIAGTSSASQTLTISNSGLDPLAISAITLTGGDSGLFTLNTGDGTQGSCGTAPTLAPAGSCTIAAVFTPSSVGAKSTVLRIASNDPVSPTRDLALAGTGGTANSLATGDVSPADPTTWTASSNAYVGYTLGDGTLRLQGGGGLASNTSYLGYAAGKTGAVIVDGAGSKWTDGGALYVGYNGTGNLAITNGGAVSTTLAEVGVNTGANGTVTVDGAGSAWTSSSALYLAYRGDSGVLNVTNGAEVDVTGITFIGNHGAINFGANGGTLSTGALFASASQLSGTGTIKTSGIQADMNLVFDASHGATQSFAVNGVTVDLSLNGNNPLIGTLGVGYLGTGTMSISGGANIASSGGYLGYKAGSTGRATISGPGSTWSSSKDTVIGDDGTGLLSISNGGSLVTGGSFIIGTDTGSTGVVTVDGAGSTLGVTNAGSPLLVGYNGGSNGTLNISNGGYVHADSPAGVGNAYLGEYAGSTGVVNVSGAGSLLKIASQFYLGDKGSGTLKLTEGGGYYHTGMYSVLVGNASGGTGRVVIDGAGSTMTGDALSLNLGYGGGSGTTSIGDGGRLTGASVWLSNASSLLTCDVGTGSALNVTGAITNNGTIRLVAGAKAASGAYTPMSAGSWTGSGSVQALGGVFDASGHTVTVSPAVTATTGVPATLDLSSQQRALVTDQTTSKSAGLGFQGSAVSAPLTFSAGAIDGAALTSMQGLIDAGKSVLSGWSFTGAAGYTEGSPVYLSLPVGSGYSLGTLTLWRFDGTAWSAYPAADLAYDGAFASFTVTGSGAYAVTGVALSQPTSLPGAPTGVTATAGAGQATVSFTAPAYDGGGTVTGYTVYSYPAGGMDTNAGSTATTHTVTGLTGGSAYTFTVAASNTAGTGAASAASNSVTPAAAPTYTVAYSGNGSTGGAVSTDGTAYLANATVSVPGPGSLARTGYAFAGWNSAADGSGTPYAAGATLVMGAGNLTLYARWQILTYGVDFTAGSNGALSGTLSQTANYGASTSSVTATATAGYHFINWTGSNGFVTTSANPLVISNITAAQSVTANFGDASAPTALTLFSDNQAYVVSGTQGNSNSGGTDYANTSFYSKGAMMISAYLDDPVEGKTARSMESLFSFNTAANLTGTAGTYAPAGAAGVGHDIIGADIVSAFNAQYGAGRWGITAVSVTLASNYYTEGVQPNNPDFNRVASGAFTLEMLANDPVISSTTTWNSLQAFLPTTTATSVGTFPWSAVQADPATNNTGTEPTVTYNLAVNDTLVGKLKSGKLTILGLAADDKVGYVFNTKNRLAPQLTVTAALLSLPGAPTGVTATAGNGQASVTFNAPADNGGGPVTGYTVTSNPAGGVDSNAGSTGQNHTVTGLSNGVAYTFTVTASSAVGTGTPSDPSNSVTPAVPVTVPGPPIMVSAAAGNAQASVSFSAPASNGNSAITGYTVVSTPSGGVDRDAGSPATTHTVTGLANGTLYSFTVTASNAAGTGRASAPSNGVTPLLMTPVIGPPSATYVKSGAQVSYLVSYTAASSITLAAADLTLARTGTANGTLTVSGSGSTGRTVTVSDITGDGTLGITVGAGTASTADSILATPSAPSAVFTVDNTAPALSVSTLADGTVTSNNTLTVSGTVSDAAALPGLTVNGTPVIPAGGTFSTALTLTAGSNTVTVTATDPAGNLSTDSRTIVLDQSAPVVTFAAPTPADGSIGRSPTVTVAGTLSEPGTVQVSIGTGAFQAAVMGSDGASFSYRADLAPGRNTVTVQATDLVNDGSRNSSTVSRTVTFDDVAPSLAVTDPAGDLTTTLGSYQLTGSVSDQYTGVSSVEVAVDGVAVVPSPTVTDGVFQLPLTFSEAKSYAVTVTATDAAGNPATVQRNIVYRPVSIGDALRALQIAVGLTAKTAADGALDVGPLANNAPHPDGIIDVSDAVAILHRLVGLVTW